MASPSPAKGCSDAGGMSSNFCALALRVPQSAKTGNFETNSKAESDRHLFMTSINECSQDMSHVLPLFTLLQKRLIARATSGAFAGFGDAAFANLTVVSKLELDFMSFWIVNVSDLTAVDVARAREYDSDALVHIFSFALQWPGGLRFRKECQIKAVVSDLAAKRHIELGKRLIDFKKKSGYDPKTGIIQWGKCECYGLVFTEELCTSIVHRPTGHTATPPEGTAITKKFVMEANHSDLDACIRLPSMPPIKLAVFFDKRGKNGPRNYTIFKGGADKTFIELAAEAHSEWEAKQTELTKSSRSVQVLECQEELKKVTTSVKRASLQKARAQAEAALKEKKKRRTIALDA